jgi:hypothetical protein
LSVQFLIGDALETLRTLPDDSVDLVVTSPPFLALRSYLPADHADKAKEMGSEGTPGAFLDALLDVIEECARVLAPHGSLCVELGDTYAGSGGAGGDYNPDGLRAGQAKFNGSGRAGRLATFSDGRGNPDAMRDTTFSGANTRSGGGNGWPLDKCLALIPELTRFTLAYGFNPLTGRQTERWRIRNVVRWCRPNPPVGALADKVRPATSDILVACKGRKRYFDLDAVRVQTGNGRDDRGTDNARVKDKRNGGGSHHGVMTQVVGQNPGGAPPLDHWWFDEEDAFPQDAGKVSTAPSKGAHYATYSPKLIVPLIEAMCPREVCRTCGKARERMTAIDYTPNRNTNGPQSIERKHLNGGSAGYAVRADRKVETTGWTDCGHDDYRPGLVLDPFAGTGVTGAVASGCGRDAILVDLDERNLELARERVGMFLEVPSPTAKPPTTESVTDQTLEAAL